MQPSLFDAQPLPPYSGRTPTARACSRAASVKAGAFGPSQRLKALTWWKQRGEYGGTDPECEAGTGISRQSLCQRRKELMERGFLAESGVTRRSPAGCPCAVYVYTERITIATEGQ